MASTFNSHAFFAAFPIAAKRLLPVIVWIPQTKSITSMLNARLTLASPRKDKDPNDNAKETPTIFSAISSTYFWVGALDR